MVRIPGLKKYQGRNPNGYFQDLNLPVRQRAYRWLTFFCERAKKRRGCVPQWLFAIYVGQAKRLAVTPPDRTWSCQMNGKKGGYAVQRLYRREGRHPTEAATRARLSKLKRRKEDEDCKKLGLPPRPRRWFTV